MIKWDNYKLFKLHIRDCEYCENEFRQLILRAKWGHEKE